MYSNSIQFLCFMPGQWHVTPFPFNSLACDKDCLVEHGIINQAQMNHDEAETISMIDDVVAYNYIS